MFSSEPPEAIDRGGWLTRDIRVDGATELGRGRRVPVRGESLRADTTPSEPPPVVADPRSAAPRPSPPSAPEPEAPETAAPGRATEPPARAATSAEELGELKQQARAALAELEATRRRVEREAEKQRDTIRGEVVTELLPVLDDLERSIGAATGSADEALLRGLDVVRDGFEQVLGKLGAERIAAEGEPFDPAVHEAIGVMPIADSALEGRVAKEWLRGYRLGGRVLRPAQVMVGRRHPS